MPTSPFSPGRPADARSTTVGPPGEDGPRSVAIVRLGCARNDVDAEEIAGRLAAHGWDLVAEPDGADVTVVNTCGFIEQAKKDSIDTVLSLHDLKSQGRTGAVVAVGCLAERYGSELAEALPEVDAVLGFDSYASLSEHLQQVLAGAPPAPHVPRDRRTLLPLAPAARPPVAPEVALPGHGLAGAGSFPVGGAQVLRARLDHRPWAPLKIASGCDRRCAFCAIPTFRGSFVSRPITDVVAEARWLAEQGVTEVLLVSENSTSYGKDLGDLRLLEALLSHLARVDGLDTIRVSYLQPAEMRPDLIEAMAAIPKVAPYFDLSFQHASGRLLRRMRRFGDADSFLALLERIRRLLPQAGVRSNVIVGFPGEGEDDVQILCDFLAAARMDAVGVFGYSDEEGTEAEGLTGHVDPEVAEERVETVSGLIDMLTAERAQERIGETVTVLIEEPPTQGSEGEPEPAVGRAAHQGPEVDGLCRVRTDAPVGARVTGEVRDSHGVDLLVEVRP